MKPLSDIKKENAKEFEEKFPNNKRWLGTLRNELHSFLSSAEDRVIEAVREWAKEKEPNGRDVNFEEDNYPAGYRNALSDLDSFLNEGLSK